MSWDVIGVIGEIVGAIGVVVSLIYLASQIRTQNQESRLAAATEWTNQWNAFLGSFAEHEHLAKVWRSGLRDFSSLNEQETVQFSSQLLRLFRAAEGLHDQYSHGRLEENTWQGIGRTLDDISRHKGVKDWWPTRSHWFSDEFISFVTPLIESEEYARMYVDKQQLEHVQAEEA